MPEQLRDVWKTYQTYTEDVSRTARTLGFAAAGIAWVFRTDSGAMPPEALKSLLLSVIFFSLDLLQYYSAAALIGIWARRKEKQAWRERQTIDVDVERPAWLDFVPRCLFHLKILALIAAFVLLIPIVL